MCRHTNQSGLVKLTSFLTIVVWCGCARGAPPTEAFGAGLSGAVYTLDVGYRAAKTDEQFAVVADLFVRDVAELVPEQRADLLPFVVAYARTLEPVSRYNLLTRVPDALTDTETSQF